MSPADSKMSRRCRDWRLDHLSLLAYLSGTLRGDATTRDELVFGFRSLLLLHSSFFILSLLLLAKGLGISVYSTVTADTIATIPSH
jgi:hypothetical protein